MADNKKSKFTDSSDSVKELLDNTMNSLDEVFGKIKKSADQTQTVDLKSISRALKNGKDSAKATEDTAVFERQGLTDEEPASDASEDLGEKKTADNILEAIKDNMANETKEQDVKIIPKAKTPAPKKPESTKPADVKKPDGKKKKEIKLHKKGFYIFNSVVMIALFAAITAALLILQRSSGFMASENRNYAEFPEFTVRSYLAGDFTSDINTWYTDTTPYREELKTIANKFTDLFGFKFGDSVIQNAGGTVEKQEFDDTKITITTVTAVVPNVNNTTTTTTTTTTVQTEQTEAVE